MPKSQGRKELAHILDPGSTACCGPHIPEECGQQSFSKQDESRQDGGSCCRRGEEKQCFPDHVQMAAPGLLSGVSARRPLQFCSAVSVDVFSTSHPLWPGGRTTGRVCRVLNICPACSGAQGAEHCCCQLLFSTEWVFAWNYEAGTDRCRSRCSRAN